MKKWLIEKKDWDGERKKFIERWKRWIWLELYISIISYVLTVLRLYETRMLLHLRHLEINSTKLLAGDQSRLQYIGRQIGHEWFNGTNTHFVFVLFIIKKKCQHTNLAWSRLKKRTGGTKLCTKHCM